MNDSMDGRLFRLERLLSKCYRMSVKTTRRQDAVYFRLNHSWTLRLDEDDVEHLVDYLDSPACFEEQVDKMLDSRMRLSEFRRDG